MSTTTTTATTTAAGQIDIVMAIVCPWAAASQAILKEFVGKKTGGVAERKQISKDELELMQQRLIKSVVNFEGPGKWIPSSGDVEDIRTLASVEATLNTHVKVESTQTYTANVA